MKEFTRVTIGDTNYIIYRRTQVDRNNVSSTFELQRNNFVLCQASHYNQLLEFITNEIHVNLHNNRHYYHGDTNE